MKDEMNGLIFTVSQLAETMDTGDSEAQRKIAENTERIASALEKIAVLMELKA